MYLQAMCNFSFARSLLEHIIGIHAGMVSADIPISHGAALIAASAQQVFIFAVSQKFPVFLSMKFAFFWILHALTVYVIRNSVTGSPLSLFSKAFPMRPIAI